MTASIKYKTLKPLLRIALAQSNIEMLRAYLEKNGRVETHDEHGQSLLMLAAAKGDINLCQLLIEYGANPESYDDKGINSIDKARQANNIILADYLQSRNPSVLDASKKIDLLSDELDEDYSWAWEVENANVPEDDLKIRAAIFEEKNVRRSHRINDVGEDWANILIELPYIDEYNVINEIFDADGKKQFANILITGRDTGVVKIESIRKLAFEMEGDCNGNLFSQLRIIVGELGYVLGDDEYHSDSDLYIDEYSESDIELIKYSEEFLLDLNCLINDPTFHISKAMKRSELLGRDGEQQLGSVIDSTLRDAYRAIARDNEAINYLLTIRIALNSGQVDLGTICRISDIEIERSFDEDIELVDITNASLIDKDSLDSIANNSLEQFNRLLDEIQNTHCENNTLKRKYEAVVNLRLTIAGIRWIYAGLIIKNYECPNLVDALIRLDFLKSKMVEANFKLVVSVANKYRWSTLHILDLIQDGNLGLLKAIEKFDFSRGTRFSTYAVWWIRQSIVRSISDKQRTIRIPVHMVDKINKLDTISRQLGIDSALDVPIDKFLVDSGMSISEIRKVLSVVQEPDKWDQCNKIRKKIEMVVDESFDPEENAIAHSLQSVVRLSVEDLPEREAKVIRYRFGLIDGQEKTLEEVGQIFGLTRERIRQIEAKAFRKLRHPSRMATLDDYRLNHRGIYDIEAS